MSPLDRVPLGPRPTRRETTVTTRTASIALSVVMLSTLSFVAAEAAEAQVTQAVATYHDDNPSAAQESVLRAQRRAMAEALELVAPFVGFSGPEQSAVLVLMNTTTDPLDVSLTLTASDGSPLPLGEFRIESARHLELQLDDSIIPEGTQRQNASLHIAYLGDVEALQGWLLLKHDSQWVEFPLASPPKQRSSSIISFWPDLSLTNALPSFRIMNSGSSTLRVRVTFGRGTRTVEAFTATLAVGQGTTLSLPDRSGPRPTWLHLDHDGSPASLVARTT